MIKLLIQIAPFHYDGISQIFNIIQKKTRNIKSYRPVGDVIEGIPGEGRACIMGFMLLSGETIVWFVEPDLIRLISIPPAFMGLFILLAWFGCAF